jgi:hypothetical protein
MGGFRYCRRGRKQIESAAWWAALARAQFCYVRSTSEVASRDLRNGTAGVPAEFIMACDHVRPESWRVTLRTPYQL